MSNATTIPQAEKAENGRVAVHISPPGWRELAAVLRECNLGDVPDFDLVALGEMREMILDWVKAEDSVGTVEMPSGIILPKENVLDVIGEFLRRDGIQKFLNFLDCLVVLKENLLRHAEQHEAGLKCLDEYKAKANSAK
jgi:hypothetical protein